MYCRQERLDCEFCNEKCGCALLNETNFKRMCPFYVSKEQFDEERREINGYVRDRRRVGSDLIKLRLPEIRAKYGNPNRR